MRCSGYVEPQDGAVSIRLLSRQEAVVCMWCIQKESRRCMRVVEIRMLQFEQQENVKFCQKLGTSASETFQVIKQVCGKEALGHSAVFKWHKRFSQRRGRLEYDQRTGQPRTVRTELKIQKVATLVHANCSQIVTEMSAAAAVRISCGTFHKIPSDDLSTSRVTQHSVPLIPTQNQHGDRMSICGDLIDNADKDRTFFNWIITGDETWCFLYNPQLKRQSATCKSQSLP
jgi:hypothetical protein